MSTPSRWRGNVVVYKCCFFGKWAFILSRMIERTANYDRATTDFLKLNILHALIRRAHATIQFNPTNTGNGLNAIVCLLCHKIFNSPMQYWIKPNLLLFLVAIVVQLKFRSCCINLDFHYDWYTDLHTGYLIFHYRCIVIVHVHDRFHYWLASCQNYRTLEKILNHWSLWPNSCCNHYFTYLFYLADLCYHYKNLSTADRNRMNETPLSGPLLYDNSLELIDLKKCQQQKNYPWYYKPFFF